MEVVKSAPIPIRRPFGSKPVTEVAGMRGLVICLYGPPGSGKTTAAGNAVHSKLVTKGMLMDAEGGVSSITHLKKLEVADPPPKDWQKIREYTKYYRDTPKEKIEENLVIWDNGSEIHKMCLDHVVRDPSQKGGAHTRPEIQHWNSVTTDYEIWIRTLRDIAGDKDITMIVTAWDRRRGGSEDAPDTEANPRVPKDLLSYNTRLAEELPGLIDIVGYITVLPTGKRRITFDASPNHSAKFRRNRYDHARAIPGTMTFGEDDYIIADIIDTLKGGEPFPKKYLGAQATTAVAAAT